MLTNQIKKSPHGSFEVTKLCQSVAVCEALAGDRLHLNFLTLGEV